MDHLLRLMAISYIFNYLPGGIMMIGNAEKWYHWLILLLPFGFTWCIYKEIK